MRGFDYWIPWIWRQALLLVLCWRIVSSVLAQADALLPAASINTVPIPAWDTNAPPRLDLAAPPPGNETVAPLVFTNAPGDTSVLSKPGSREPLTGINSALIGDRTGLMTTGLVERTVTDAERSKQSHYELLLATARHQRMERNNQQAEKILAQIIESGAGDELKRTALMELALVAQQANEPAKAIHIFGQFIQLYPQDISLPEILLRQGLIYRKMGANSLALSKFYSVMTRAMSLKIDHLSYYQRLTLQAKIEIAETYFETGQYEEAAQKYQSLLLEESPDLNRSQIAYKHIRCLVSRQQYEQVAKQARQFIDDYPSASELAEVRFLLASALKQLGRNRDSRQQVLLLLQAKSASSAQNRADWAYWQQRTGNEIANQLYKEGDYLNALDIYLNLVELDKSASWQLPVWYQIGLVYERLNQPQKAGDTYGRILLLDKELGTNNTPALRTVIEMAKWRADFMGWHTKAEQKARETKLTAPVGGAAAPQP